MVQEYWLPALVTIISLLVCLLISLKPHWGSSVTLADEVWEKMLTLHLSDYPFSVRPFQSYATLWLHQFSSLPVRESFYTIQFTLAFSLGLTFYALMKRLAFSRTWSVVGLVLLMTAYPMMGAHFAPTHTWDDFWGYLFLTLAFLFFLRKQPLVGAVWLTLGIVAREQIAVFIPVYLLGLWWQREDFDRRLLFTSALIPILVTLGIRLLFGETADIDRWSKHIGYNFGTPPARSDSFASLIIAFGILWPLPFAALRVLAGKTVLPQQRLWVVGLVITVPLTVLLALTGGMARETRLFFPPFIFIVPLSVIALKAAFTHARPNWKWPEMVSIAIILALLCVLGVRASREWFFPTFDYGTNAGVRQAWIGLCLGFYATALIAIGYDRTIQILSRKRS